MKNLALPQRPNLFNAICDIAMTDHFLARNGRYVATSTISRSHAEWTKWIHDRIEQGILKYPTFRKPTSHPRGYLAALKFIASHENGVKRRELMDYYGLKSVSFTIDRLMYAGFLDHCRYTHKYSISSFGRAYLAAVESEFNA